MRGRDYLHLSSRLFVAALLLLATAPAFGQPYGAWLNNSAGHGYIDLPDSIDFAGGSFTFEAWVSVTASGSSECDSIAGNGFQSSTWIGICGTTLRSYVRGGGSSYTVGTVPAANWTHIAVTFDNATKTLSHYIDGELVGQRVEPSGITPSAGGWRIFSDANWQYTPNGAIDEVRFWNVARTLDQIRSTITKQIDAPTTGLVAVYELDSDATDAVGSLHGTKVGSSANYMTSAISSGCTSNNSTLCVGSGGRFQITASYKTVNSSGNGSRVNFQTSDSGLFTFFSATNWEVVIKVLDACVVPFNRYWVFASGLTDQHVELVVTDLQHGVTNRYFNYQGKPFTAIADTDAFATCP